jgi:hypothetical protein
MQDKQFRIGDIVFHYELSHVNDTTWVASLAKLQDVSKTNMDNQDIREVGNTEEQSVERLKVKLRSSFLLSGESITLSQLPTIAYKWICSGTNIKQKVARLVIILMVVILTSPFYFDYFSGTSPISKNIVGALTTFKRGYIVDKGFFDEQFFASALQSAQKRFWASGVSFRNLISGNREPLIKLLNRDVEFKLVLLDPESPLAQDGFIKHISRTATKVDITSSISKYLNESDGILLHQGNKNRHQLWTSGYAPIVPMVVIDDTIFVSFLVHVDPTRVQNAYRSPYLRFEAGSEMGKILLKHFESMLRGSETHLKYPAN